MSNAIFESTIRSFVAKGSEIDARDVVPGLISAEPPKTGLYASVAPLSERRLWQSIRFQQITEDRSYTQTVNSILAVMRIEWYREGAIDAAYRFADWAMSETGLTWANTAIVDGRIAGVNVYEGGSGYVEGETCVLSARVGTPSPNIQATGYITTNGLGACTGVLLNNNGQGYWVPPAIVIDSASGSGAATSPRGYGFAVKFPVDVKNITGMIAGDYEERAVVDIQIAYDRVFDDFESGRIERVIGERNVEGITTATAPPPVVPPPNEDRLVYVFQTTLVPSDADTSTSVGGAGDGIAVDRIAEWSKDNIAIPDGSNGIGEITLFNASAIVPQYGRNLIATSPFITNYEGHIIATFPSVTESSLYSVVYYIRTTHAIPNQPAITSTRAVKRSAWAITGRGGLSIPIALTDFNSMTILDNDIPNGGVIGIKLDFGIAFMGGRSETDINQSVKELNTGSPLSTPPVRDLTLNLNGFNTRVTFLQHNLSGA